MGRAEPRRRSELPERAAGILLLAEGSPLVFDGITAFDMPHSETRDGFEITCETCETCQAVSIQVPLSGDLQAHEEYSLYRSTLKRQAQLTVLASKAGVAVSADLRLGGFDTHDNHDENQGWLLRNLTDSVD